MQLVIFLIEIVLIFFWLEYDSVDSKKLNMDSSAYSTYTSLDIIGDEILTLDGLSEEKKIDVWRGSALQKEMLSHFPNIYLITDFLRNRVVDSGDFRDRYIEYIEYIHGEYVSGTMNKEEFREAIKNPQFSVIPY